MAPNFWLSYKNLFNIQWHKEKIFKHLPILSKQVKYNQNQCDTVNK